MRLIETLFDSHGYNPLIRPVTNLSEIVTIKFGLAMIQLINVVRATTPHQLALLERYDTIRDAILTCA